MQTEKQKMLAGSLYNPLDEERTRDRTRVIILLQKLNNAPADDADVKKHFPSSTAFCST